MGTSKDNISLICDFFHTQHSNPRPWLRNERPLTSHADPNWYIVKVSERDGVQFLGKIQSQPEG